MPERICIVDDSIENRERISTIIRNNTNYEIFTAESGVDLLNLFKDLKDKTPDLILLDILMPKMNGFEVAELLKTSEIGKEIPIIFITALNDVENFSKAFELGCVDYISKPFRKQELLARINVQINQKRLLDQLKKQTKELDSQKDILEKKNTILETSLEILSHDTKNILANIKGIISQNYNSPVACMIEECLNELYELMMEAIGYMKSVKRIESIIDIINKLHVTKDRTLVFDHERIKLKYSDEQFLFIETSRLIKNAITNIIENALKYSSEDTIVDIIIENKNKIIYIDIIDRGTGIPLTEREKIFEKYYRIEKNKNIEGSGRGLWITKNIILNEGGNLFYYENKGEGSIFSIQLPEYHIDNFQVGLKNLSEWYNIPLEKIKLREENLRTSILLNNSDIQNIDSIVFTNLLINLRKESQIKKISNIKEKLLSFKNKNPKGKKVLIVDDSLYVHYYLTAYFVELGYNVVGYAGNGKDGVLFYKELKPDLVTLDNNMPVKSGIEAGEEIYKFNKNVKILFISAVGGAKHFKKNIEEKLPEKNYHIIEKPISKEDIENVLKDFI